VWMYTGTVLEKHVNCIVAAILSSYMLEQRFCLASNPQTHSFGAEQRVRLLGACQPGWCQEMNPERRNHDGL
jgi:hypothetical protein